MALFNVSVLAHLQLPELVRRAIIRSVVAQERTAAALEAILAKINEASADVPPELHDAVEELEAVTEAVAKAQEPQAP